MNTNMKRTTIATIALAAIAATAAPAQDATVLTTLFSDGATNAWTQADLQAALQLTNRKYHRDMKTPQGRRSWHGEMTAQTIVNPADTNLAALVETYEDGYCHTNKFTRRAALTAEERAARVAANRRARAAALAAQTSGVPAAVTEARQTAVDNADAPTTTTNVTVTVGGGN